MFVLLAIFFFIGGESYTQKAMTGCEIPNGIVSLSFPKAKYPNIREHQLLSIREGWPSVYVLNRKGADARRSKALDGIPTKAGFNRDEEPPAVGRKTWHTHVALVPASENKSHGATMGAKLRPYCDGTQFVYTWY